MYIVLAVRYYPQIAVGDCGGCGGAITQSQMPNSHKFGGFGVLVVMVW
ncbi:hypothetical protein LC608_33675 [Nostoc sp. XA010]|nr:hypothetical protein [Nostoc sp. XA010]MCC5661810.1 hypothetical protein [Nostoc sp. XA010]